MQKAMQKCSRRTYSEECRLLDLKKVVLKLWSNSYLTYHSQVYALVLKAKLSLQLAVDAHGVVSCRGYHIFYTISSLMAVISALSASHPLPIGRFLVQIFLRGSLQITYVTVSCVRFLAELGRHAMYTGQQYAVQDLRNGHINNRQNRAVYICELLQTFRL
jgi:hypothetical protein